MRRFLYENEFSSGYPRTRDDAHERASDDRNENDRERDNGDHGNDPRRQGDALKPGTQMKELIKQRKLKS